MRDASLDEFLGGESDGSGGDGEETGDGEVRETAPESDETTSAGEETERASEPEAESEAESDSEVEADVETGTDAGSEASPTELTVEPATSTYAFSPEGGECAACGASVETRWHGEGVGLVCEDCKDW